MCEFISWKEVTDKNGKVHLFYLTANDIWNTKRGKELIKYCQNSDDFVGHGAIDYYYQLNGKGVSKECIDFATPDNFPKEIVKDIKRGAFRGIRISSELLTQPALVEYKKIEQPAWAEYEKIKQQARAEYEKIEQPALAEYEKIGQPAWAKYEKIRQQAWVEYDKIRQDIFWDLFANPKNRTKKWR